MFGLLEQGFIRNGISHGNMKTYSSQLLKNRDQIWGWPLAKWIVIDRDMKNYYLSPLLYVEDGRLLSFGIKWPKTIHMYSLRS